MSGIIPAATSENSTFNTKTAPSSAEDVVTQITGNYGRWQLRTIVLIFLCKIPSAWFMAAIIYTAPAPKKGEYYCKPSEVDLNLGNTQPEWVRMSHPMASDERHTDREFYVDACHIYERSLEHDFAKLYSNFTNPFKRPAVAINVIPCKHFEHNSDYTSLVTQFNLVCSRQLLISVTQSFHALGALIGGLLAMKALKHISPRDLMLIGMIFQIVFGNLTGLVTTFQLHVFFRCLTSVFCAFMYTSGQNILADITGGKAKTIVITLFELFWSIGLILLPGISIFFDSWSYLYMMISSSVIVLVFLHRWIADSPRWLLRHNKIDRALQQLLECAAFNNCEIPLNLVHQLEIYAAELQHEKAYNYCSIWDGKTPYKFLLSIHFAWIWAAVLYNVMLLTIRQLGVDYIHVNTLSLGFSEMIGVFLGLFLILYTRRRWLYAGYIMIIAGILTYIVWLVPERLKENRRIAAQFIFWIILKLSNSASLAVLTTCSGEMVSAKKRPLLMISVVTVSRFALIIAPFISTLSIIHQLLPITCFATMAIFNGFLMCYLNRTFWNREQPRIEKVLTPTTYRRNSAIILLRRSSTCSELSCHNIVNACYDNPLTISITELWNMDVRFRTSQDSSNSFKCDVHEENL